ncbi:hypothetical protein ACFLQI_01845 [Candidatus Undinarchaeota archaeon]
MKKAASFLFGVFLLLLAPFLTFKTCAFTELYGGDCGTFAIIFYGVPFTLIFYPIVMKIIDRLGV